MDYLVRGPNLPKAGETIDGIDFLRAGGGKGANQAVAAARLGARVAFVGKVGLDEAGDELLDLLRAEGINVQWVRRDRTIPTGVALIMVDEAGEKQIMVAPGANNHVTVEDVRRAGSLISGAKILLMQFEVPIPSVLVAARLAGDAGVSIVLDPAPPLVPEGARKSGHTARLRQKSGLVPKELINRVALIRPNSSEAKAMTGIAVTDITSARKAARVLLGLGAGRHAGG
jgi:ribokinase